MADDQTAVQPTRGAVTRDEVLDIAAEIFARNGYRATNLTRVAERLNVTRQALYYHFASKSEILAALFNKLMSALEQAATEAAEGVEPSARFDAMLRAHMSVIIAKADLAAILLHERAEIARIDGVDAAARRRVYSQQFFDAYAAGADAGTLRELEPRATVNAVLGAVNAVSWWYRPAEHATHDESADALFALLSQGFQPAANGRH